MLADLHTFVVIREDVEIWQLPPLATDCSAEINNPRNGPFAVGIRGLVACAHLQPQVFAGRARHRPRRGIQGRKIWNKALELSLGIIAHEQHCRYRDDSAHHHNGDAGGGEALLAIAAVAHSRVHSKGGLCAQEDEEHGARDDGDAADRKIGEPDASEGGEVVEDGVGDDGGEAHQDDDLEAVCLQCPVQGARPTAASVDMLQPTMEGISAEEEGDQRTQRGAGEDDSGADGHARGQAIAHSIDRARGQRRDSSGEADDGEECGDDNEGEGALYFVVLQPRGVNLPQPPNLLVKHG
mmetsp:Transcript_8635/g.15611  ORF Transcript_8635/g.15611 Transcript_8635/m.15611 type:complete len:296 (-) Transcript_8635:99-986(-)